MGLFHSILSYLYPTQTSITPDQIRLSAQRLAHHLKLKIAKIQNANHTLETQFLAIINNPKRDLILEKIHIDNMILASLNFAVHQELYYSAQRIKNQAQLISSNLNKVSDQCLAAIYSIVHLYKDLELNELVDLAQFIPEPFPVIGADKLQANIRTFLEYKKPTDYQRNLYVLELIKRHEGKVSILQLNKLNHGFTQKPQIPQNQVPMDSNNLYARSASYQIVQEHEEFAA